jgi:ribose transport system substrate-binding protein
MKRPNSIGRQVLEERNLQGRISMKRRDFLKLSTTVAGAAMTIYMPAGWTPAMAAAKRKVGFSQCTTLEPWRVQFNKDIQAEAKNHPDVELIITDGQDKTEKQVADCENLVVQQVHVLLISPKESAGLTGVVEKAIDAKIPVIVLDRNVDTKRITQFIGGDNVAIGRAAGEHAVKLLGGPGKAAGNVVEIWGGMGTQPAHDRHDGFHALTNKEPGIKNLLNNQSGDWKQAKAYNIMTTTLRHNEKIDLVYGHNDPMAYGAYLAAKDAGRDKDIKFIIGIDGLPDEGVTWVNKGQLTATFLYATPGAEGLRQAIKLLHGEKLEPVITLPTMLISKENAPEILKKNGLL